VMGTRLDVTEDSERHAFDAEDPDAAAMVVYAYVGWLEGQFVDVLADALPDVPDERAARPDDGGSSGDDDDAADAPEDASRPPSRD